MRDEGMRRFCRLSCLAIAAAAASLVPGCAGVARPRPVARQATLWWQQQKINFMWGGWPSCFKSPSPHDIDPVFAKYERPVPRETFKYAAQAGATVFADLWKYSPEHARFAKEFGLKYFSSVHLGHMKPGGRRWVNQDGREVQKSAGHMHTCPLDESEYARWLADEPVQQGIREGIVDGIHVDWESTEGGICYCDDCFAKFLETGGVKAQLPEKAKRFGFIQARDLAQAYEENFHRRRFGMFTSIREKLQAINPQLVFSSYGTTLSDFTRAVHTPEAPFILLDARHYYNDDRQPWWQSYSQRLREEGYLYIAGGWTNALFGAQPSQVSAARWIYEAMINEDGVWLWFEHKLTDDVFAAYATANRKVRTVESAAGDFLFHGERDPHFVTAVEWTGNPQLERAAVQRTYHLGDRHLVHVNNVNADWPLRVRLRFPRLAQGMWTARDPLGDVYYTDDGRSTLWSADQLRAGIVVTLDARSDLFVLLTPGAGEPAAGGAALIHSSEFDTFFSHGDAADNVVVEASAAPAKPDSIYGPNLEELLAASSKLMELPMAGWRFRWDKSDAGTGESWFLPETTLDGWEPIETGRFWGEQGGEWGSGWYRSDVHVPQLPAGKHIYLHFGAVDEQLRLWIDGRYIGEYNRGAEGWDQPFAMEVTGKLTGAEHHLAMRVYNTGYAGGVWKPVSVLVGPDIAEQDLHKPAGQLLYTAAEKMLGFPGEWGSAHRCFVNNAIRTVAADGESGQRLRHLHGHLWSPSYSPDGSRVVFVHDAGGRGQICNMNTDGSGAANLSSNDFCDRSPVWSPDGRRIAFISDREADWAICIMNADGSDQRCLAGNVGLDRAPAWSPDGRRIAWESHVSGMPNIWVVDVNGGTSRPLIAPDKPLTVRQGGNDKDGVFAFAEVGWPFADNAVYLTNPVWSPDGKRIAARGLGAYSGVTATVLDADGGSMLQAIGWIGGADDLVWSPDGSKLAGTLRTAPQETDRSGIFVVAADGSESYRWLVDVGPAGPRLSNATRVGVPTWYSHGSAQPRRVVKTFTSVAWSPDGKTLAFSSDMAPGGAFYVHTISAEGGKAVRLDATQSARPNEVTWRPEGDR